MRLARIDISDRPMARIYASCQEVEVSVIRMTTIHDLRCGETQGFFFSTAAVRRELKLMHQQNMIAATQ